MSSFLSHLECSSCTARCDPDEIHTVCPTCGKALLVRYNLHRARSVLRRDGLGAPADSLWRFGPLLPVRDARNVVSLGEGGTPVVRLQRMGAAVGLSGLWMKDEGMNPTGSFKSRGMSVAVSRARELRVSEVAVPSAGNAGGALAAYAASAGMRAHVFMPEDTPRMNIREVEMFGAEAVLVRGTISDAAKRLNDANGAGKWFDCSTLKEPYRLEGKKTMGFEIAEQFGWELPDVILYPTGGGTGLIGIWKAFSELEVLGWIGPKRPRMVAVQSAGCAPIVRAFAGGDRVAGFWDNAHTVASGLRVPKPFADHLILGVLYESKGTAVAVDDAQIVSDMKNLARTEGVMVCPEGAAALSGLRELVKQGIIRGSETVLLLNTGAGYKYAELLT